MTWQERIDRAVASEQEQMERALANIAQAIAEGRVSEDEGQAMMQRREDWAEGRIRWIKGETR